MAGLPTGTVTFLFTDIEGSTKLLERLGDGYTSLLERHGEILRSAIAGGGGVEVGTEGDSFFAVFPTASGAVQSAVEAQRALGSEAWPDPVRVRMGLHTGEGVLGGDNYVGLDVHRAARLASAAHGGQILLSATTRALAEGSLPPGITVRPLGVHRLKDLAQPVELSQLVIDGLPSAFPPPRTLDARPNNLPAQPTPFIGREKELSRVRELLDGARLLTLTGPGGTGKTRLSLEAAADALERFRDGAYFVDLSSIMDPDLVAPTIAQALGLQEAPDRSWPELLRDHVAGLEMLLILDNFEQVTGAAGLVSDLLAGAPKLTVLVTSREALGVYGEREYGVPPLVTPEDPARCDAAALNQYEAVQLFVQRAAAVKHDFRVTNDNAPAVAQIVASLDGLPLAIELAAARVKLLPPEAIMGRLDRRLSLLTAGARTLPARQRSLRGAIEWSYDLLDETERRMFERLAAFVGGFDLEAAEAVARPEDVGLEAIDAVTSLVDKSLVRAEHPGTGDERFVMLETIREFGVERLAASDDRAPVEARHTDHFLSLAVRSEPEIVGKDQVRWLDRLDRDHGNLRAALDRAAETGKIQEALAACGAVWRWWHQRGHLREARARVEHLLALPGAGEPTAARARALGAAGSLAYWQNDFAPSRAHYEEALDIARKLGDEAVLAEALYNRAFSEMLEQRMEEGRDLLIESAALYERAGSRRWVADVKGTIGWIEGTLGRLEEAIPPMEEGIEILRQEGDLFGLADGLSGLTQAYRKVGRLDDARRSALEALALFRRANNLTGIALIVESIGDLSFEAGDLERALRLVGAARVVREAAGGGAPRELVQFRDVEAETRPLLGDERVEALLAEGRAMSLDEAIALAGSPPR